MSVHGKSLVVFGGYIGTFVNDLWLYSTVDNSWTEVSTPSAPPKRRAHGATVHADHLYIFGGFNGDTFMSDLWELDFGEP